MASLIYNSLWNDVAKGNVDFDTDTFKVALLGAAYAADKDTHARRSSLTNEMPGTGGYTAAGAAVTVTVPAIDTANDRQDITLGGATWAASTITNARFAAYYKVRAGVAANEELVALIDFGTDKSSSGGDFVLSASTLRIQN